VAEDFERGLILVVDDNETARYAKARTLRLAGYETLESGSGEDALRLIAQHKPRLVVLDVQLPDIDGWSVCRRVKSDPVSASVLVLQVSATFVSEEDTVRALEGGADACLTEPLEPPVLVATVRALLRARRAEEALRDALAREQVARGAAESANRAKDEFLALLSHELRTPLGAILNWVTLLRDGEVERSVMGRGLEAIERNTRIQAKLIEDLLDVSRIVTGKTHLDTALVDLTHVVDAALESVRPAAKSKGIRIGGSLSPSKALVQGDATRLQQVIWNLVSNAVKFTSHGGWVEVQVERRGDEAVVLVSDSGKGIDPGFLPYIFDRFRQADSSTTRSEGGLGLGLAIVRHVIELHGGSVAAHSEGPEKGATFTVRLPIAHASDAAPIAVQRAQTPALEPVSARQLAGLAALVVDDDPDARDAAGAVLEAAGAKVRLASNVRDALAAIDAGGPPDVLISDIAMPVEDGFSLIRALRRSQPQGGRRLPTLALTAFAGEHAVEQIREAGFDAYLAKPIEARKLIAAVAKLAADAG
jgi:signal transduction histidine kinase